MKLIKIALAAAAAAVSAAAPAADAPERRPVAIVGATVLPMTDTERLANQTVIVSGDRIFAIGPSSELAVPEGVTVIDGRGKYLMPGLVDMHAHVAPVTGEPGDPAQRALAMMLAHGTTTARGMAGSPQNLVVRRKVEEGELAGPRLYAASPALHDKSVPTIARAREAVRAARLAGFDLIKSHAITDVAVWQAVQDAAEAQGLPVGGHVTNEVELAQAMAAGQQIEHLDGTVAALIPEDSPAARIAFGQIPPPTVVQAVDAAGEAPLQALAERVAAANSWHVPTLSLFEKILDMETPTAELQADPAMRFVPDQTLQQWAAQRDQLRQMGLTPADARAIVDLRRRIAGAFHEAGVPLMAGSDTAQAFHVWGPALHEEIASLHAAGLSRMEALRAATVVPRDYFRATPNGGSTLGWSAAFGTVEEGARADLILLDGDPSQDLSALHRPSVVIAGGRLYDRAALDALLEQASADAKMKAPPIAAADLPDKVFVVRHLQKAAGDDPALTAEGAANARALAELLTDEGIVAVFATPTRRAMETGAPLAERLGISVTPYNPGDPDGLVRAVAVADGNVLVVGHSNTVPDLVERFGGARPAPLTEQDYGTIYTVAPGEGEVSTTSLR